MFWAAGFVSMLVAFAATKLSIALSLRGGVLDMPNMRSSHSEPVPRLGGIGILVAVAVAAGVLATIGPHLSETPSLLTRPTMVMIGAGLGMAAIGFYDDLYGLRPAVKLLCQLVLAGAIAAWGCHIESVQIADWGPFALGLASVPVTILWLTGFANIFNFMDGINGISGVSGATFFLFFSIFAWLGSSPELTLFGVIFASACIGFLPHNFPVARTFMGDTGSLMLGIVLGFYVVYLAQRSPGMLLPLLLVCSIYLWDSGFTILLRLRRRENILHPHRSHLYQRLVKAGLSHARITTLYWILHLVMGLLALACYRSGGLLRAGIATLSVFILAAFTGAVFWVEKRWLREKSSQNHGTAA